MFNGRSAFFLLAVSAAVFAVAALIFLSPIGNVIFVLLMISFIGIPLAIVLALIPPIALLLGLAALIAWPFRRLGWPAVLLAFVPAAALLFYAPDLLNAAAEKEAQALTGSDIGDGPAPFAGRSIAVFVAPTHSEDCLDFCQRALVSGAVDAFFVARSKKTWPEPDFDAAGTAYRLENRASCDAVKIRDNARDYPVAPDAPPPGPALRLKIASGTCLVAEQCAVRDADAILQYGEMVEGRYSRYSLDPFYVPMRALRLAWLVNDGKDFKETFRQTAVNYSVLTRPLVPGLFGGSQLKMEAGLSRQERRLGPDRDALNLAAFLRDQLKIDLSFDASAAGTARDETLDFVLRKSVDLSPAQQSLVGDAFAALAADTKTVDRAQFERAIQLLADPRVEVPDRVSAYVATAYRSDAEMRDRAMAVFFDRLGALVRGDGSDTGFSRSSALRRMAYAMESIPDTDLAGQWPRFRAVFADPEATSIFADQVKRAKSAGKIAFGDLLALVDAAAPKQEDRVFMDKFLRGNRFVAMGAICMAGPEARELLPAIEERLRSGAIPLAESSDVRLAAYTLQALGGDPEMVRGLAKPGFKQKDFDAQVDAAIIEVRKRGGCF
jgi:hypothetical protein